MDIRVGGSGAVGPPGQRRSEDRSEPIEARILAVRTPRRGVQGPPPATPERRRDPARRDPPGGRVLVLLIPSDPRLPADLDRHPYRVFLRFVRR